MKKLLLLLAFLACGFIVNAQITFERAYDSASSIHNSSGVSVNDMLFLFH